MQPAAVSAAVGASGRDLENVKEAQRGLPA